MLTLRGAALLASAGLLWFAGRLVGVDELYVVAVAAAALVALAWLAVRLPGDRVAVRRLLSTNRLDHRGDGEVTVQLRNDGRLPTPALLIGDDVAPALITDPPRFAVDGLAPRRSVTLRYAVLGRRRGRFPVGPVELRITDPFGLARRTRRTRSVDELIVYPRVDPLPDGPGTATHAGRADGDQHRVLHTGDEFHTMREYVQGDDLRMVHWPSTARRATLMVRQQERPWHAEATVLVDTRAGAHRGQGDAATLEAAISAGASVVRHLVRRRHRVRLVTEADPVVTPASDWRALLDRLAVAEPSGVANLAAVGERLRSGAGEGLLVTCVAPPPGSEPVGGAPDTRALLRAGRAFAAQVALVVHVPDEPERAEEQVALLRAAGWRAVAVPAGTDLAQVWPALTARAAARAR